MYNWSLSTEANYAVDENWAEEHHGGDFSYERSVLDYRYHARYTCGRAALQDEIVRCALRAAAATPAPPMSCSAVSSSSSGSEADVVPNELESPWLLFTAGPMGAGKSHVVSWLRARNLFPLEQIVRSDPDAFRYQLPEWPCYKALDPETAGAMTQKEAGLLVELTTEAGMARGMNVWQDGSFQDREFFHTKIDYIRRRYPRYKIAVMYVTAAEATVRRRAEQRAGISGRVVPRADIDRSLSEAAQAFCHLAPQADVALVIDNEVDFGRPSLREVRMGRHVLSGSALGGLSGLRGIFAEVERLGPLVARACRSPPRCMQAMTWNLLAPCYFRMGVQQSLGLESDRPEIFLPRVRKQMKLLQQYDVVFLQELWLQNPLIAEVFHEETKDTFSVVTAARDMPQGDCVAVLARKGLFEVGFSCTIPLPHGRVAAAAELRPLPAAAAAVGGVANLGGATGFFAVSCHLNFPHIPGDENRRQLQVDVLCRHVDVLSRRLAQQRGFDIVPVLMAGDFNTPRGVTVRGSGIGDALLDRGFRSAHCEVHGREPGATHRNHNGELWGSDAVLARPGGGLTWRFETAFLLPASEGDTAEFERPRPCSRVPEGDPQTLGEWADLSDHRPLVAHLELVPATSPASKEAPLEARPTPSPAAPRSKM